MMRKQQIQKSVALSKERENYNHKSQLYLCILPSIAALITRSVVILLFLKEEH